MRFWPLRSFGLRKSSDKIPLKLEAAHQHRWILIRASQSGDSGALQNNPTDAVPLSQAVQIARGELFPISLCLQLFKPLFRERGEHRNRAAVLAVVGEAAAPCQAAKAYRLFPGNSLILGIDGKNSVLRSVVSHPQESLCPRVFRCRPGPLDV